MVATILQTQWEAYLAAFTYSERSVVTYRFFAWPAFTSDDTGIVPKARCQGMEELASTSAGSSSSSTLRRGLLALIEQLVAPVPTARTANSSSNLRGSLVTVILHFSG